MVSKFFISAVARIMEPGCKHDTVPVLEGPQGIGKSTALKLLFRPYFSDDMAELGSKDASMQVRTAWCTELAELSSMSGQRRSASSRSSAAVWTVPAELRAACDRGAASDLC